MKQQPFIFYRDRAFTLLLAEDEYAFCVDRAEQLGSTLSSVVRNAACAAPMQSQNPLDTAPEQLVASIARVGKWWRERADRT